MDRPPLTPNAIAGIINDADLDPMQAMNDIGYRPLSVREGLRRHFPIEALDLGGQHTGLASNPEGTST
jgi:hypothetical protein